MKRILSIQIATFLLVVASALLHVHSAQAIGEVCDGTYGTCQDDRTYSCSGDWLTGLCPGGTNIRCCSLRSIITGSGSGTGVPPAPTTSVIGTSCDSGFGSCRDRNTYACTGSWITGLCPGGTNIQCCSQRSAMSGSGGGATLPFGPTPAMPTPSATIPSPVPGTTGQLPSASQPWDATINAVQGSLGLPSPPGGIAQILTNVLTWLMGVFGLLAVMAFIVSGIMYLTSAGDTGRAETAKKYVFASVIGVIVGLSGMIIVRAISTWLGGGNAF